MEDIQLDKIRAFIYDVGHGYTFSFPFYFKRRYITRDTKLISDLRITGDDADEFFLEFAKHFNVDVSNFKIGDFFGDEEDYITAAIKDIFRDKERGLKPITVGDLERAILAGRLDDSILDSRSPH